MTTPHEHIAEALKLAKAAAWALFKARDTLRQAGRREDGEKCRVVQYRIGDIEPEIEKLAKEIPE